MSYRCLGHAASGIEPHDAELSEFTPSVQDAILKRERGEGARHGQVCGECKRTRDRLRYKEKTEWYDERNRTNRAVRMGRRHDKGITKAKVYEMGRGRCHVCLQPLDYEDCHIEHVQPMRRGGTDTWDNVMPAHSACNWMKGTKTMEELREMGVLRRLRYGVEVGSGSVA